jgi:glutamate formiminotransferase
MKDISQRLKEFEDNNKLERALVECVPNFSEGRRKEIIDAIASSMASVDGASLLHTTSDLDHNRTVITIAGSPASVAHAALLGMKKAKELIDLRTHTGEHPRIGATDVVPFVPVSGITMEQCAKLAWLVGELAWQELGIPVYFYESAAKRPSMVNLADVRKGEFEGLSAEVLTNPERRPDVGGPGLHESAGASVVGARQFLVAYNVNLNTADVSIAKKIARAIRERDGGLPKVKALGFMIEEKACAQVSMNLVDCDITPPLRVLEAIKAEAAKYGVLASEGELIGLIPLKYLMETAAAALMLPSLHEDQVLEALVWRKP